MATLRPAPHARRGATVVEVVAVLFLLLLILLAFVVLSPRRPSSTHGRGTKDGYQLRGLLQGFTLWADLHGDRFPLPSAVDLADATVPEPGAAKDTTANIDSLLIYNSYFPAEMLISPLEINRRIREDEDYEFDEPSGAADPANALWDPAFSADFTGGGTGNTSYAHLLPGGARLDRWRPVIGPGWAAIVSNRGPRIAGVRYDDRGRALPTLADPASLTLGMHGEPDRWAGFVGYADNHVDFENDMVGSSGDLGEGVPRFTDARGEARHDILFYDEPDDASGANNFLGIFTRAGPEATDFVAVWD